MTDSKTRGLTLDQLEDEELLTTKQVSELRLFGTSGSLEQARCTGADSPPWIKIAGRVWYRARTLKQYVADQEARSKAEYEERRLLSTRGRPRKLASA